MNEQTLTITLNEQQFNTIMRGLSELPLKDVLNTFNYLAQQAQAMQQEAPQK